MTPSQGIRLPASDRFSPVIRDSIARGEYEQVELGLLTDLLRDGDRVLELGSGLGLLATHCAQRLGSEAVLTVEADPEMGPVLRETFAANGVSPGLLFGAVTADGAPRRLRRSEHFWSTRVERISEGDGGLTVQGIALAQLVSAHRPTVLAIDIEGGESDLAPTDLSGVRAVLIECHSMPDRDSVFRWLGPQGFSPVILAQRRVRLFERIH